MSLRIRGDSVGAFIDAVYAIAVTILALEIPAELSRGAAGPEGTADVASFAALLVEYAIAFILLFCLWLQHRRINGLTEEPTRSSLWTTAAVLALVCLVPRATTLVFRFGGDVTLAELHGTLLHGAGWTLAELVDLFFVTVVVLADLGLLLLLVTSRTPGARSASAPLQRSKVATSALLVLVLALSFALPVQNRYVLLVIPVVLFFEDEIVALIVRVWAPRPS